MEQDYTKREIDIIFDRQEDHLKYIREKVDSIEAQTKITTNRVSNLENWKFYLSGAIAILTIIVLPIAFMIFNNLIYG